MRSGSRRKPASASSGLKGPAIISGAGALSCSPRNYRTTAFAPNSPSAAIPANVCHLGPVDGVSFELTSGIADALAIAADGTIDAVVDWKSDVNPDATVLELYRGQVRDYLAATGASKGFIVFLTSGRVEEIAPCVNAGL